MNAAQSVTAVKVEFGNGDTDWFDVVEVNDSGELTLSDTMWVDDEGQVWNYRGDEHWTVDWWGEVIDYAVYNAEINDIMTLSKLSMPRSTGGEK